NSNTKPRESLSLVLPTLLWLHFLKSLLGLPFRTLLVYKHLLFCLGPRLSLSHIEQAPDRRTKYAIHARLVQLVVFPPKCPSATVEPATEMLKDASTCSPVQPLDVVWKRHKCGVERRLGFLSCNHLIPPFQSFCVPAFHLLVGRKR